jgi:ParB-like chromosome segregation protein Spo0J
MRPIVVTSGDASIVDGHARLLAAQELGFNNVPAVSVNEPNLRTRQRENC